MNHIYIGIKGSTFVLIYLRKQFISLISFVFLIRGSFLVSNFEHNVTLSNVFGGCFIAKGQTGAFSHATTHHTTISGLQQHLSTSLCFPSLYTLHRKIIYTISTFHAFGVFFLRHTTSLEIPTRSFLFTPNVLTLQQQNT